MKKSILLLFVTIIFQVSSIAQSKTESMKTALLIIDIQEFYFPTETNPGLVGAEEASLVAKEVLAVFRENEQLVVHVRHQSEEGFAIHSNVEPLDSEKVITKSEINGFLGTDLLEYLKSKEITRLVVIGMQTQMCLEAAVRAGHDYGFECIVVGDACATRDLQFEEKTVKAAEVHNSTLATLVGGGYANVINLQSFQKNPEQFLFQLLR